MAIVKRSTESASRSLSRDSEHRKRTEYWDGAAVGATETAAKRLA
jgi:hypothetical protein